MRILSIDFDYFVDTDLETRSFYFPDGNDNLPHELNLFIWNNCYSFKEELRSIGVIKDYDYMCELLKNLKPRKTLIADSHREIEKFFDDVRSSDKVELVHIDFHHDMFVTGGDKLDCGNWLRFFADIKPDAKITWVKREDSSRESMFGEFPYNETTDITEVKGDFDLVFLCLSTPWTPPHLYDKFKEMCKALNS